MTNNQQFRDAIDREVKTAQVNAQAILDSFPPDQKRLIQEVLSQQHRVFKPAFRQLRQAGIYLTYEQFNALYVLLHAGQDGSEPTAVSVMEEFGRFFQQLIIEPLKESASPKIHIKDWITTVLTGVIAGNILSLLGEMFLNPKPQLPLLLGLLAFSIAVFIALFNRSRKLIR